MLYISGVPRDKLKGSRFEGSLEVKGSKLEGSLEIN